MATHTPFHRHKMLCSKVACVCKLINFLSRAVFEMFYVYLASYNTWNKLLSKINQQKIVVSKTEPTPSFSLFFRCSSDIAGTFVCEKGPCPHENCIISKLFKEGCTFLYNSTQNATASIMFMQSLSSVSISLGWQTPIRFHLFPRYMTCF